MAYWNLEDREPTMKSSVDKLWFCFMLWDNFEKEQKWAQQNKSTVSRK
jgi:hypothetical protein